jgi:DNA-binding NarL/FixJ family response regulator
MEKYSMIVVDDHKLFREGLKLLLSNLEYIEEVEEASNCNEFLQLLSGKKPDIVFMDIDMPDTDGIETTRRALERRPGLNVIALTMYSDEDYFTRMIYAGAKGFILKNSGIQEVEEAIHNVMAGNSYFSREILNTLVQSISRKKKIVKSGELSEREEEVLYLICKGLSNKEIGDKLFISKRTVDKHRENILLKTNSKNTAHLVMYAIKHGIVDV